jgi:hypothetical protein
VADRAVFRYWFRCGRELRRLQRLRREYTTSEKFLIILAPLLEISDATKIGAVASVRDGGWDPLEKAEGVPLGLRPRAADATDMVSPTLSASRDFARQPRGGKHA